MRATSDEQRAAFEAWITERYHGNTHRVLSKQTDGEYISGPMQFALDAWQACAAQQAPQERADERNAARYRWLRELPNANSLNVKFCGADLDKVSDAGITDAARRNDG